MSRHVPISLFSFVACAFLWPAIASADPAHDWLMKINYAVRMLDYDGIFVYQHDEQTDTLRIVHKVENKSSRERLISLNGVAREIIRNDREVRCYWPDKKSVMVEYRKTGEKNFPAILPEHLQVLDENYTIQLGGIDRIAGRVTQQVIIRPKDGYRYGYRLWADKDTGLLLKTVLMDHSGKTLEQFMFTQISIGGKIPASALLPENPEQGLVWYRADEAVNAADAKLNWLVKRLPKGFQLAMHVTRPAPWRNKSHNLLLEHMVYSDGLAAVSVFVEKPGNDAKPFIQGMSHMGAVHAHGARVQDYQITAVGVAPADTVTLIGSSVERLQ